MINLLEPNLVLGGTIFDLTSVILQEYNLTDHAAGVRHWYNGYLIGNLESVYNPWSILNFITNRTLRAYWVNTSDNKLIQRLVEESSITIKAVRYFHRSLLNVIRF